MIEYYEKERLHSKKRQQIKHEKLLKKQNAKRIAVIHDLRKMRHEKQAEIKEHELIDAQKKLKEAAPKEKKIKKIIVRKSN